MKQKSLKNKRLFWTYLPSSRQHLFQCAVYHAFVVKAKHESESCDVAFRYNFFRNMMFSFRNVFIIWFSTMFILHSRGCLIIVAIRFWEFPLGLPVFCVLWCTVDGVVLPRVATGPLGGKSDWICVTVHRLVGPPSQEGGRCGRKPDDCWLLLGAVPVTSFFLPTRD